MKEYNDYIEKFYSDNYLKNRYPSPAYLLQQGPFQNGDSPDLAAVALGFKKSAILPIKDLSREVNDYYLTQSLYSGKTVYYLDEYQIAIICDRQNLDKIIDAYRNCNDSELGIALDYPTHLVYLFSQCMENGFPNWKEYDRKAEEFAKKFL